MRTIASDDPVAWCDCDSQSFARLRCAKRLNGSTSCMWLTFSGSVVSVAACGPRGRGFDAPLCSGCPVKVTT